MPTRPLLDVAVGTRTHTTDPNTQVANMVMTRSAKRRHQQMLRMEQQDL